MPRPFLWTVALWIVLMLLISPSQSDRKTESAIELSDEVASDLAVEPHTHYLHDCSSQLITVGVDGHIWAVNRWTGRREWSYDTGAPIFSFQCASPSSYSFLLIPSSNGDLYTYNDGSLVRIGTTIQELVGGAPLHTDDGSFWMASKTMQMWAFDSHGDVVHSWASGIPYSEPLPQVEPWEEILIITRVIYHIQAIDPLSGLMKWNISMSQFNSPQLSAFDNTAGARSSRQERARPLGQGASEDDPIVIASDGSIYLLGRDGYRWIDKLPSGIVHSFDLEQDTLEKEDTPKSTYWRLRWPPRNVALPSHLRVSIPSSDRHFPGIFVGVHNGHLYAVPVSTAHQHNLRAPWEIPAIEAGHSRPPKEGDLSLVSLPESADVSSPCDEHSPDFPYCLQGYNWVVDDVHSSSALVRTDDVDGGRWDAERVMSKPSKTQQLIIFNIIWPTALCLVAGGYIVFRRMKSSPTDSSIKQPSNPHPPLHIGNIFVSEEILGYGSSGTIVYKGSLDGRQVAVKRMLREYFDVAAKEIRMLQRSDEHRNVVRYYLHEKDQNFVYLALSCCRMSIEDLLSSHKTGPNPVSRQMLLEAAQGLHHIHSLSIIHRDLKPHNILLDYDGRVRISDMGLAKRLGHDQHSITSQTSGGTFGWQAPEQMETTLRQSRSVDIFSLGCIIYYCLTLGVHPFGDKSEREYRISHNRPNLSKLNHDPVAQDLVQRMIAYQPKQRWTAAQVLNHPFFWGAAKTLEFLRIASDRLECEPASAPIVVDMERRKHLLGAQSDWLSQIDPLLQSEFTSSKYRKYKAHKVRDLLRVIRNKTHHYRDLSPPLQQQLGSLPDGFLNYWQTRFPRLFIETYQVILKYCPNEPNFSHFFPTSSS